MEVEQAKIKFIGKVRELKNGSKMLSVDMLLPLSGEKRFVIYENKVGKFDLIKLFLNNHFQVGDIVAFDFNKAQEDWQYDNIWKLRKRNGGEEPESNTTPARGK